MRWTAPISVVALIALLLMVGCQDEPPSKGPAYSVHPPVQSTPLYQMAVLPVFNPSKSLASYQPLLTYLDQHVAQAQFKLVVSRDYTSFESKIRNRQTELIYGNPLHALMALKAGYHVLVKVGDEKLRRGIIITRTDSELHSPLDLRGKSISFASPTGFSACILVQAYLHEQGLDIEHDIKSVYVGTQDSVLMNVYMQNTAAGATSYNAWRVFSKAHPAETAELKISWETPPFVSNPILVRNDVPPAVLEALRKALLELDTLPQGPSILEHLGHTSYQLSSDSDYDAVEPWLRRFETEVRPLEEQ